MRGNDKSLAQTRIHHLSDFQPVRRPFAAVSFRPRAHRRTRRNTKTTIYDCRRSRSELISPDFTSAPSNPTDRSLRLILFFPLVFFFSTSSSSTSSRTHVRMGQKEIPRDVPRCPSRASQKRAVRSSITTVRTVVASSAKEGDDRRKARRKERRKGTRGNRRTGRDGERKGGRRVEENGTVEEPSS